ncbi:MAG: ribonucleoside triphosphate reductase [Candidatus Asgardarchaeia archaeon]
METVEQKKKVEENRFVDVPDLVNSYLNQLDWRVRENSNMGYSLQGLNFHISSSIIARYWLTEVYPEDIAHAHIDGAFHIHDLGMLSVYCVGWDLADFLKVGFKGARGKIESRPPKHFRVALGQLVNLFYTLQGEAAGAQAVSSFDTYLAPFIRYDKLSYKEVKQAMQEFLYNMNVPTRVGGQTPFTNITIDLQPPSFMANDPVIIGGKEMPETYSEFAKEMAMINRAFAEIMMEGDAKGRVFTFPIPTINITKDFNWDNEEFIPIWEMTAKYGIPYFANFVNSDMNPEDVRSMCCHLRLDNRELYRRGGGLFGANPLTGSIGVVTINMPRIGYISKDDDDFFENLGHLMELARDSLELKRKVIEKLTEQGLYPYSRFYLRTVKQMYGKYWANHFSTIGILGMNEALLNFMGVTIGDKEGIKFASRVMDYMLERLREFQIDTDNLYNLEATPAEGASYRLAKIDKQKYPNIIVANNSAVKEKGAAPYYTNSTLLPVNYTDDIFEVLELQDELQTKYTGGTVLHIYLGERAPSWKVVRNLVNKITHNYRLPYFTITPTFSVCPVHGYLSGEHHYCPKCKEELGMDVECEVYSRVVGYLRPVNQWNDGKQSEFKDRLTYDKSFVLLQPSNPDDYKH